MVELIARYINIKMIPTIMIAVVALTVIASNMFFFKEPRLRYNERQQIITQLKQGFFDTKLIGSRIAHAETDIEQLNQELYGEGPRLSPNQMVAYIIAKFDEIALHHNVQLGSVQPGNTSDLMMFSETPYYIELQGRYFDLHAWLSDIKSKLGPFVIKQFEIQPLATTDGRRTMTLTLASYRLQE